MGPHLMGRPPKFVQGFIDRHGKARFYFRRAGFKAVPLPGLPWSPEFMAAYESALAGQAVPIGSARVKPGTMRALAVSYYGSIAYHSMQSSTQSVYRNIIDKLCQETDKDGHPHGDKNAATLQREHIVKLMAARAERPDSANGLRTVLRAMMKPADGNYDRCGCLGAFRQEAGLIATQRSELSDFDHEVRHGNFPVGNIAVDAFSG